MLRLTAFAGDPGLAEADRRRFTLVGDLGRHVASGVLTRRSEVAQAMRQSATSLKSVLARYLFVDEPPYAPLFQWERGLLQVVYMHFKDSGQWLPTGHPDLRATTPLASEWAQRLPRALAYVFNNALALTLRGIRDSVGSEADIDLAARALPYIKAACEQGTQTFTVERIAQEMGLSDIESRKVVEMFRETTWIGGSGPDRLMITEGICRVVDIEDLIEQSFGRA